MARCVLLSSFSSFLATSLFKSQSGLRGANFTKSCNQHQIYFHSPDVATVFSFTARIIVNKMIHECGSSHK